MTCSPPGLKHVYQGIIERVHSDGTYSVILPETHGYDEESYTGIKSIRGKPSKDTSSKELFVHHTGCIPKDYGAEGFGDNGEVTLFKNGGIWFELFEIVYFQRHPEKSNIAINVTTINPTPIETLDELESGVENPKALRGTVKSPSSGAAVHPPQSTPIKKRGTRKVELHPSPGDVLTPVKTPARSKKSSKPKRKPPPKPAPRAVRELPPTPVK